MLRIQTEAQKKRPESDGSDLNLLHLCLLVTDLKKDDHLVSDFPYIVHYFVLSVTHDPIY